MNALSPFFPLTPSNPGVPAAGEPAGRDSNCLAVVRYLLLSVFLIVTFAGCAIPQKPKDTLADSGIIPIVYSKNYNIGIPFAQGFTDFDLKKFSKIQRELIRQRLRTKDEFLVPRKISREELLLVHTEEYLAKLTKSAHVARALQAPLAILPSPVVRSAVVDPFMFSSGGTVLAGRRALERGIAINLGGGYAHASSDQGEGFNLIADVPIAIRVLQKEGRIRRAMIVDLDVHKGQGDILVFKGDKSVHIMDMYEMGIYPTGKFSLPANRDVPLPYHCSEERYMKELRDNLPGAIREAKPDLIFFVAGSDPYCKDKLGNVQMSFNGMVERDLYVINEARTRHIPIVMVLSGGYSDDSWRIHFESIKEMILKYEESQE